ncbi:MAG: ATPase/DNA packaging protein [Sulfobacillus sp.]
MSKKEVTLALKKFDMSQIKDNVIIVAIGKRNTGKSMLVLDYLFHNRNIPIGTCISPTNPYNGTYSGHVPEKFIHDEYSPELIEGVLKRQRQNIQNIKNDPEYRNVDPRAFLILDDCLYDSKDWVKNKNIRWIFMNGRHSKLTMIMTMQYCMGIPPNLRTNIDYVFICKEPRLAMRRRLFEQYATAIPTFDMFCQILDQVTKDFGCLVLDTSSTSDKIEDQVFYYRADNHSDFRVCLPEFWKDNDQIIRQRSNEEEEELPDYIKYNKGSNKVKYRIK